MAGSDDDAYLRVTGRIQRAMAVIALVGSLALAQRLGWRYGLGFLFGAGLSYLSLWRWKRVVESLGPAQTPAKTPAVASMLFRFALLVGAAYGIIRYLEVNPVAVLMGLLVSAAAVVVSLFFELFATK